MYTSFFGLNEKPFSITPDPRYLFMSARHGEALAHLVYGVTESGGFVQLTGEVGTGKTTLVRSLLLNRMPDNADVAVVLNPQITAREFLLTICEELKIGVPEEKDSVKALTDALNRHLLDAHANGRRTILVVDEAQNLAPGVLEQVRLLTNLETAKQKLLQIILIGQPELRELLARNDLRQLAQRITGRYHLEPLTREETAQYVEHRLRVAGAVGELIDNGAKKEVFRLSAGVPRLINVICDRALLGAYTQETRIVTRRTIRRAAAEVAGALEKKPATHRIAAITGIVAIAVVAGSVWLQKTQTMPTNDVTALEERVHTTNVSRPTIDVAPPTDSSIADSAAERVAESPQTHPGPTLIEELALAGELTTDDYALASLFELWGLEYTRGGNDGCTQAVTAGLACLRQRSSWRALQQLDRPAILEVTAENGDTHQIVLTAISGESADLSIGGVDVSHPITEVTDLWFGQFLLLWRPPNGSSVSLAPGVRSNDVVRLRENLSRIDPRYASTESDVYDASLADIVRAFQRDHRLEVDGLAGQKTLIVINSLLGTDNSPRLTVAAHRPAPQLARD